MLVPIEESLKVLCCPECKGNLIYSEDGSQPHFNCPRCSADFPVIDGIPRFLKVDEILLRQAKEHWEDSPHFQYEAKVPLYSKEYYEEQDRWRAEDVDQFSMDIYQFDRVAGKITLDIGCGSGWVVKQAAKAGAFSVGVDFTERAAFSSYEALRLNGLTGLVVQADAQALPIKDGVVQRLFPIGVLHHIPNTERGVAEAYRVMACGATAIISLYGKLFFFNPILFPIARIALRLLLKAPEKRDGIQHTKDYQEFYRLMDGPSNPIGRFYTDDELRILLAKFRILSQSRSHFPIRFLKLGPISLKLITPKALLCFLDQRAGMMCNMQLEKP